ncbi:MAG: MotA/TolQ/ExbB proton channel family protein [Planctomycetota bacterium]|nr:MAG: MotA/TolQ/ExbB proton channel family protein [Planctomycetota bacterium]
MHKSFLLRIFLLIFLLAVVLGVIVVGLPLRKAAQRGDTAAVRADYGQMAAEAGRRQSLFEQFVIAGGPIVWFVLLPMSVLMVYLAVEYGLTIRRKKLLPCGVSAEAVETLQRYGPEKLKERIADRGDFVSVAVIKAVTQGKGDWFRMRNLLFESLQEQASRLMRRIEWLNLIGNVSPMVGLFGTVFGMIKLFDAIVTAGGQPQPAQLAGGISVALVTTFWGLFIAIPALAIHGVFRNRIETLANDAVIEAEHIVPEIRRSIKKQMVSTAEPRTAARLKQPISELLAKSRKASGDSVRLR